MKVERSRRRAGSPEEVSVLTRRLFSAVRNADLSQLRRLIFQTKANINERNQRGENCLIEALRIDDSKHRQLLARFLIKCGVDVYNRDKTHRDSLEWAVKLGRVKEAFTLLTGPMVEYNFSHTDIDGLSVLHHATINRMTPIVSVIVIRLKKYSCSVDIPDSHGITPYLHARRVGCNEIADMLLEAGASPHQADTRFHMTANSWTAVGHQEQEFQQVCLRQKGVNELMIAGRLPALRKRNMAHASSNTSIPSLLSMTNFSQSENNLSQTSDTLKITSLFDLKLEGSTVDKFYNSINERDSPDERGSGGASTNDVGSSPRQQKGNSVVSNLGAILDLVSQQMSDAFQPGVKRPDPSQSSRDLLAHDKGSTLAAIMGLKRRSLKKSLDAGRRKGSQASGNGKLANKKYTPLPVIAANADD